VRRFLTLLLLGLAALAGLPAKAQQADSLLPPGFVERELEIDLGGATLRQLEVIRVLVEAARIMDTLYREQVEGEGFYPADMSREEFEAWRDPGAASPYTVVRRDPWGALEAVPYHQAWSRELGLVARLLARAAALTSDESLRNYLTQRARALIIGDYRRAEAAWQAMRYSDIDVLIGPIGHDADRKFGLKAGFGAYVMLRDWSWGAQVAGFTVFLPEMQRDLPVSPAFRAEVPDVDMKIAVYDLLFHAGYGAAHTEAVTVDGVGEPRLRLRHGPQRLQLRNVTRARFDALVLPVADALLAPEQRGRADFDAYLLNLVFHEMAQVLGPTETLSGGVPVYRALAEHGDAIAEAKGAALSLWLAGWLHARGELPATTLMHHYASFLAGALRTIHLDRYGAPGRGNALVLNYLRDWGAIRRDAATGRYRIEPDNMDAALEALVAQLLTIQGGGDIEGAAALLDSMGSPRADLDADLARLAAAGIPAGVLFRRTADLPGM
jgi:hypothetical protein